MRHHVPFLTSAVLGLASSAFAHDFWLEPGGEALALRLGHRGGELLAIDQRRVKSFLCSQAAAPREELAHATFAPKEVRLAARCLAASATLDSGVYSLTPDGEVNLPRTQVANVVKAWASRQFAKWVESSAAASALLLGDELELVPVSDLSKVREGDKVTVRVLHRGKPVANAVIAIDHKPLGETDSAGEARIKVRTSGVETINATLRRPISTPEAESEVLEASLSFKVTS
jgi:nickel transport protein